MSQQSSKSQKQNSVNKIQTNAIIADEIKTNAGNIIGNEIINHTGRFKWKIQFTRNTNPI